MSTDQDNAAEIDSNEASIEYQEAYSRTMGMLQNQCGGRDAAVGAIEAAIDWVRQNKVEDPESGILLVHTQEWQALDKCIEAARDWATASIVEPE